MQTTKGHIAVFGGVGERLRLDNGKTKKGSPRYLCKDCGITKKFKICSENFIFFKNGLYALSE